MTTTTEMEKHEQAPIIVNAEVLFWVDEKLQTLIQFLWDNNVKTYNSCEDNVEGTCWVEYQLADWIEISEIAFRSVPQDLYLFIEEECDVKLQSCDDGQPDENDEYWIDGDNLIWTASVRFPKELLPTFESVIKATLVEPILNWDEQRP